jgi:hypothetical protein
LGLQFLSQDRPGQQFLWKKIELSLLLQNKIIKSDQNFYFLTFLLDFASGGKTAVAWW